MIANAPTLIDALIGWLSDIKGNGLRHVWNVVDPSAQKIQFLRK